MFNSSMMDTEASLKPTLRQKTPLFLETSDDDDETMLQLPPPPSEPEDDLDIQLIPRSVSVHSRGSTPPYPAIPTPLTRSPSPKSRVEPPSVSEGPPAKRRKVDSTPHSYRLGTILVGNAWSTVKGKGYIQNSERVSIERDSAPSSGPASSAKGKGKTKQMTLTAMMKQPNKAPNFRKPKVDTVVRLANTRGFEFGRLPQDIADWVSKLMDQGIIYLEGTMIDCPAPLHSGAEMIMSLEIFLLSSAFISPNQKGTQKQTSSFGFQQGQESLDERILRERKGALLKLFTALSLQPKQGVDEAGFRRTQQTAKGKQKEPEEDEEEGEVLSENQLDVIYKKAQKNDQTLESMDPPGTFAMTLRPYQKQALHWMHSIELGNQTSRAHSLHPLWSEYTFPPLAKDGVIDLTDGEAPFYFNPYSGELSLEFPRAEVVCRGGILADVGMGKTIMLSSLIHTNCIPEPLDEISNTTKQRQLKLNFASTSGKKKRDAFATLIVAPTSLLSQWAEELKRSSKPGGVKTLIWHGQNRADLETILQEEEGTIQVVITSYGVIASEHSKTGKQKSPLFEVEWLRVILDEAHHCKLRSSKTARAVYELKARRRWAVTGTPIVNRLEDLYSLLKFLRFAPWDDFAFFRSFITVPFMDRDPKALEIVQVILESVLLRREKTMRDIDGNPIVALPEKEIKIVSLELSLAERKIYDSIYNYAKRNFENLQAKGLLSRNYTNLLAMLMRLRRAVLHTSLILTGEQSAETENSESAERVEINEMVKRYLYGDGEGQDDGQGGNNAAFAEGFLNSLADGEPKECPICLDVMDAPMVIPNCLHQCCKECITAYLASCEEKAEPSRCPTCSFGPIKESELLEVVRSELASLSQPVPNIALRKNNFRSSTKIDALLAALRHLRDQDPCFRAVVFSQFTSFLDLIQTALNRDGFEHQRFDGCMDVKKRSAAISAFKEQTRSPKVLLVSLKAGGVGLNLTVANHVFLMDCWWNAAVENQAIDRVHRIGQQRTVYVKQFIMVNTIEERILKIQKRKTAIIKEAFRSKDSRGDESESLENLKIMFEDI